ncbi:MAG TPA: OadG-related small transporter subunit [Spirochaetales bacterium]|nr:OadG family protein [Spirochaetales bacterium]HOV38281.1 OadG-related small transporter subunit [Spirochaetales bacterium]
MNELLQRIIQGNDFEKALFLLVVGVGFVFLVQCVFYFVIKLFIKLFPEGKKEQPEKP